jgi:hypothetical protein
VLGVSADDPEITAELRTRLELPFTLLSDPELRTADALDAPVCAGACFAATLPLHPVALPRYPKKAFLQPALYVWTTGPAPAYTWKQRGKLRNLFGAAGRPSGAQVVEVVREALTARSPAG